jgi:surface antigen/LysM repeat protein
VVAIIAASYHAPETATTVASVVPTQSDTVNETSVNEVVATNIAADVAEVTNLPVATNVANLSVSLTIKSELSAITTGSDGLTKQQIIQPTSDRHELIAYTVKAGDTVDSLASTYGISKDTIKWANGLTSDSLTVGKELTIPPVDSVVYTVKDGDTIEKLAEKYKASASRITSFNNLELGGLTKDIKIIIPAGQLPENERPGYTPPRQNYNIPSRWSTSFASGGGSSRILYVNRNPTSPGNKNVWGNCTWFAWEYRQSIGRPLPARALGNANSWNISLAYLGVDHRPEIGAILQTSFGGGGYGHVGVVVGIGADGSVTVREMNYAGYNVVSERTLSAAQAAAYNYIH